MKRLKYPGTNAVFITLISAIYAFIFIFTANHVEFTRLLSHPQTLQADFWNNWAAFIKTGNMKYIGYTIMAMAFFIVVFSVRGKNGGKSGYDEGQINILSRGLTVAGILTTMLLPVALILILSDPSYSIETMFLLLIVQWFGVLITDIFYVVRCSR